MGKPACVKIDHAVPLKYFSMANRTFMCIICGFVYEEAEGLPEEGIAPGTRWEDIPDDWQCPDCDATKADFEMIEI